MVQPAVSFVRIGPASTKELNGPGPFRGLIVWPGPDQYLLDLLEVILKGSGRVQGVCTHRLNRYSEGSGMCNKTLHLQGSTLRIYDSSSHQLLFCT